MDNPSLRCLRGELVVIGKQPDGDSIRFAPADPSGLAALKRADRIRRSTTDGTVQLRLEAIDAPETHYAGLAQPLGDPARDRLLKLAGFQQVEHDGETVTGAVPARVPAAILAAMADANGRPVSLLLVGDELPADGTFAEVTPALLARTLNAALLSDGSAYLTLYTSLDAGLAAPLRQLARTAREQSLGVWAQDASDAFALRTQADIGPGGALVLPKLFRRCSDYLRTRTPGETLPAWLRTHGDPARPEDDRVIVAGTETRLSDLVEQRGEEIAFAADLLDLVFVEK
jgi:endonuclease YncB( thermonuclease family)